MNTLRTITVAVLLVAVAATSAPAGTIGVFFDQERTVTSAAYDPFVEFDMYLMMYDVDAHVNAVEYKLNLPPQVAITGVQYGGDQPLALVDDEQYGTILGFGGCELIYNASPQDDFVVAHITAMAVTTFDEATITVTKFTGGGDGNPAAVGPRYSGCQGGENEMTASTAELSGGVATFTRSFGAVKALYE